MKKIVQKIAGLLFCAIICSAAGYKGSLPNIEPQFEYLKTTPKVTQPLFNSIDELDKPAGYTKTPRDNKTYVDLILKKDKTSPYINDLNDIITIMEKMQKCIEGQGNVQKFNAIASSIIDHADYMNEKYANKPEKYYISFKKYQELAAQARAIATLRCEAQIYIKYLTYQNEGQVYSKENIQRQMSYFSQELNTTIQVLRDAN